MMLSGLLGVVFTAVLQAGAPADTVPQARPPALPSDTGVVAALVRPSVPADTPVVRRRVRAIEVSEWYSRRLAIHRALSYTIVPLFALQWDAGERLYKHPIDSPGWVLPTHRATAAALGTVFAVNTVTGLWNLWDSRNVSEGRTLRTVHALSMLTADAGFTYAGAVLSRPARNDLGKRKLHREIAISSMALSTVSGLVMKFFNQ